MRPRQTEEFEALLGAQSTSVWRLVVRVLGDDGPDAADCFQQAFVELALRHKRSHDIRQMPALLKRIATARAIDTVRRRIRERGRSRPVEGVEVTSRQSLQPDALAEANEFIDALRAELAALPDAQATAFVLTQIDGLPHDEAAVAMGVTRNHLNVLLHRARAQLRDKLESHQPVREARP